MAKKGTSAIVIVFIMSVVLVSMFWIYISSDTGFGGLGDSATNIIIIDDENIAWDTDGLLAAARVEKDKNIPPGLLKKDDTSISGDATELTVPQVSFDYVAYYKFNSDASDEGGNYDGVLKGDAAIVSDGERGNVLGLDGDGDYVDLGTFDPSEHDISISLWYYLNDDPESSYIGLVTKSDSWGTDTSRWQLSRDSNLGYVIFARKNNMSYFYNYDLEPSRWVNLVLVQDSESSSLYADGELVGSSDDIIFGSDVDSVVQIGNGFNGLIDDVVIYNRPLSSSEISEIYNNGVIDSPVEPEPPVLCDLTSAFWTASSVTEGINVGLIVDGSNCVGESILFRIYESDPFGDDEITVLNGVYDRTSWKAEYINDVSGIPEFYFVATLAGNSTESVRSGLMKVAAIVSCEDDVGCSSAGNFCDGNVPYSCSLKADDCYDRVNDADCGADASCVDGGCVAFSKVPSDYIAYYKFDNAASDETGNHNGVMMDNAKVVSDADKGNVLELDGKNDYVDLSNPDGLNMPTSYTISSWIKSTSQDFRKTIFSNRYGENCVSDDWVYLNYKVRVDDTGLADMIFVRPDKNYDATRVKSTTNLFDNSWHHLVATYDGNSNRIYVDGVLEGTKSNVGSPNVRANSEVTIGVDYADGVCSNLDVWWEGKLDDVMVYDRALSLSEVGEIYDEQQPTLIPCTPESASATCGIWTCGTRNNNCGDPVTCGSCDASESCVSGSCTGACVPDCVGKVCGGDGCGGTCGSGCSSGEVCVDGGCVVLSSNFYYLDPVNGNTVSGDGTRSRPWGSLNSVVDAGYFNGWKIAGGDTLRLLNGYHGSFNSEVNSEIRAHKKNSGYINIEAEPGHNPKLGGVTCKSCSYWKFKGLELGPSVNGGTPSLHTQSNIPAIFYGYDNDHMTFENNYLYTVEDTSSWDVLDWSNRTWHGIKMGARSHHFIFKNNVIKNVAMGVVSTGKYGLFENNLIDGYASDGIASLEANTIVRGNTIINTYADLYWSGHFHTDGIQYSGYYNYSNITIINNYLNALPDYNRPGVGPGGSQGIFGGGLYDSLIANNVIMVQNHAHGISPDHQSQWNLKIVNNTIISPYGIEPLSEPDIRLNRPLSDIEISNNVAHEVPWNNPSRNIIIKNNANTEELNPFTMFIDYKNSDMRPSPNGPLCDGSINGKPGVAVGALPCS